jgi:hypothetical protein
MERLKTRQRLNQLNLQPDVVRESTKVIPDIDVDDGHLSAKIRVNSIINQSIPNMSYAPKKIKSHVTKQELAEFQQKENTPIEYNGQFYRLHPATVEEPILEFVPPQVVLQNEITVREQKGSRINKILVDMKQKKMELEQVNQRLSQLDKEYNHAINSMQGQNQEYFDGLFQFQRDQLESSKTDIITILDQLKAELDEAHYYVDSFDEDLPEGLAAIKAAQERNKSRVKAYEENLKMLNRNFNITQEQGESDENYLARLKEQTQAVEDPNQVVDRFNLFEARKFKDNLKEIIRDSSTIEYTYNTLSQEDDSLIPEINKIFSLIKSRYQTLYGNVQLKDDDLVKFLKKILQNPIESVRVVEQEEQGLVDKYNSLLRRGRYTKTQLIGLIHEISQYIAQEQISINIKGNQAKLLIGIRGGLSYNYNGKDKPLNMADKETLAGIFVKILQLVKEKDPFKYAEINASLNEKTQNEYGEGLKHQELPKSCKLGKIEVDLNKLFHKNILSIRQKGYKLNGVKNVSVGDEFVHIIIQLCKGIYPSTKDLNKLGLHEHEIFDSLLHLAGLHKRVEHTADKTIPKLKQRLELIGGEITAGNTNKSLKDEMRDIVYKLHHLNEITQNAATDYLKQFR